MLAELGLTEEDWSQTPPAAHAALTLLWQQNLLLQSRCAAYEVQVERLQVQVGELEKLSLEVAELRERLGRNSGNSSQPPSSDPPHQRRARTPASSGRQRGGQPGHPGHGRKLLPVEKVDRVVELRPVSCQQCGSLLLGDDPQPLRRQLSEVPPAQAVTTEYRAHALTCLHCGARNTAAWPADLPAGSFGPRAQAVVAYLTGRLNLSQRDVTEALQVLHGLPLSLGSVPALQQQVSAALAQPVETAQRFVAQQPRHYVDETGWFEQHRLQWLWVDATSQVTTFYLYQGRGQKQAQAILGSKFAGVVTTDRYHAYHWLPDERRQLCWAHLKRDFQAFAERAGQSVDIGQALLAEVKELFTRWYELRSGRCAWPTFQQAVTPIQARVKQLLEQGTQCEHAKTAGTCRQILKRETALWTFTRIEGVEPTNNAAERSLRRAVLWRRKSFGTQSATGSQFVARILTVVTTLRQQGRDVLAGLTAACSAATGTATPCCLLPDTS